MKKGCVIPVVIVLQLALIGWLYAKFFRAEELPASGAAGAPTPAANAAADAAKPVPPPPPPVETTLADFTLAAAPRPLSVKLQTAVRSCRTGMVVDLTNRQILWEKNADEPVEIASMTKMMTAYLLMRAVYVDKRVKLTDVLPVTRTAEGVGGSQVWIAQGEHFTIEEMAKCMMIKSANDATELIAEHLGDGSANFVVAMNQKAQQLGLVRMKFYNAHGLPPDKAHKHPENEGTARELVFLASLLMEWPDVVRWASTKEDKLIHQKGNKVTQLVNHNRLVGKPGVNGMKTGYTAKSMYCTTVTCTRNGRTIIVVVTGCPGLYGRQRDVLVGQLLDWAYVQQPAAAPAPAPTAPAAPAHPAAAAH